MEISGGLILIAGLILFTILSHRLAQSEANDGTENAGVPTIAVGDPTSSGGTSIEDIIRSVAKQFGEDPALMLAIAKKESSMNPAAVNLGDPSYGLFQIQVFWLKHFGFTADKNLLFDPETASEVAARILQYFRNRQNPLTGDWFQFPADVDIYNVGETLWAHGTRNIGYRDQVTKYYREFGGLS